MSTFAPKQHLSRSNRFFAVTPSRLAAVVEHDLSRAELLVWAAVEMGAKPRCPVAFTYAKLAESLHLSVDTIRRAVRRLLSLGLVVGFFKANTHHLAPATGAREDAGESLALVQGGDSSAPTFSPPLDAVEPGTGAAVSRKNLASAPGLVAEKSVPVDVSAQAPYVTSPESKEKLSLCLCPVARQLVEEWNVFPKVAVDLVQRYGPEKVTQVMAWGGWLKSKGKLRSLGWVYQALTRGWVVPEGFQKATKAPTPHRQSADTPAPTKAEEAPSTPESQLSTIKQMLASPIPAVRRMGEKLASDWGVPLEAARAV